MRQFLSGSLKYLPDPLHSFPHIMTEFIRLNPISVRPSTITLPGSKSISNRCLLLAALSHNQCQIRSLLRSDDTERMLEALHTLGIPIEHTADGCLNVHGQGGRFPQPSADLFLGNAGTAFRPLTAALAVLGGDYHLHGIPRMHERPIGDLVDALLNAGADIRYSDKTGYPPLRIGHFHDNGNRILSVKGNVSSQFLTALLMALPLTGNAYQIQIEGGLISKPYIDITLNLMEKFGVTVTNNHYRSFHIPSGSRYTSPEILHIEGDASSASYFLAAGLLSGVPIKVEGIGRHAIQGDTAFALELEKIGADVAWGDNFIQVSRRPNQAIRAFDLDANHIPDAAMTLAVVALAADAPCTLRNIGSWRVKETDRIAAMATELRKVGAAVEERPDSIRITPPPQLTPNARIDTYDDHRIAMCFSLVSLLGVPIEINDPKCTHKTFPDYFRVFSTLSAD